MQSLIRWRKLYRMKASDIAENFAQEPAPNGKSKGSKARRAQKPIVRIAHCPHCDGALDIGGL